MRVRSSLLAIAVSLLASCSGDPEPAAARPPVSIVSSEWTLRVDPDARTITLDRGGATMLRLEGDALQLGARDVVDDRTNYDPYPIFVPDGVTPPPDDLVWLVPERFDVAQASGDALEIDVAYPKGVRARLHLAIGARDGRFDATLTPTGGTLAYVRIAPTIDANEGLYGLGEQFDDVNQRGHVRPMQIEVDGEIESNYNEVHVPIPLLIGTRGWGLFVESPYPMVFDVAKTKSDRVDAIVGTGLATTSGVAFHLIGAKHPLDVTKHYHDLTGSPVLPARWALGPLMWRDENRDQAQVEDDVAKIRSLDLATSAIWIDRPYATAVNTFDFAAPQFPDPKAMIAKAHAAGLRMGLWHVPYLDEKDAATKALRDEANAQGYYPPAVGLNLNKWGKPIDLTNPAAFAWWQSLITKYTDPTTGFGIEGFKLDYGEDVVPGLIGNARNVWRFADGSDERTMHQRFQLFYHRAYAEKLPKDGGFLICRHATIGDQVSVSMIWPGDLSADFTKHREVVTESDGKKRVSVGGLPASVVGGLSLGPSGFPFYGSDTGGYRHSPPSKETFTRWFEQTALSTVMQVGNSASTVPWELDGKTGWDEEMLGWYRTYARLHMRLFAYEWGYAQQMLEDGRPIARPLGLAHPEIGAHPNDEYMFGDDLLVAPVLEPGKTSRAVMFPSGRWFDWWTGQAYEGGTTTDVPAPLGTLPLFVREGGTIPMLRPTIDAIAPATDPDVDSFANDAGILWVRVAPGAEPGKRVVFDGATIEHRRDGATLTMSSTDGKEFTKGVVFEAIAIAKAPSEVKDGGAAVDSVADLAALDAAASGWFWSSGTLYVKVPAGTHTVTALLP